MKIVTDYPGGNVIIREIKEDEVYLERGYTIENLHQWGANLVKAMTETLL